MYHYVRDAEGTEFPGIKAISIEKFERQLDYLRKNYSVISWPDLRDFLQNKRTLPSRPCILTFDDGLKDGYTNIYQRLKERNISGLFFPLAREPENGLAMIHMLQLAIAKIGEIEFRDLFLDELNDDERRQFISACALFEKEHPTTKLGEDAFRIFRKAITYIPDIAMPVLRRIFNELVGDDVAVARDFYLQKKEIEEMSAGNMHFGGHGTEHFRFSKISEEAQKKEIDGSAEFLGDLELVPWAFAYPYGDYDARSFQLLAGGNFIAAFSTEEKTTHDDQYAIGRVDAASFLPQK